METPTQRTVPANPFGEQFRTFHFYPSESHKQVVHRITRGLEGNCGLILLTGEIGIGKTSVCRHLMQSFGESYVFAESGNPFLKPAEQLYHFCKQFGVDTTGRNSIHDLTEALHVFFIEQAEAGTKPVIIMDESHLLATEHFSLLLVLYNMRQGSMPLVQIILIGQVEIMDRLREPGFEALNQRIGVRCELSPLNVQETMNYIRFKLEHAEFPNQNVFEQKTLKKIWQVTGGLPRLINHACSHALDQISFTGAQTVSEKLIDEVSSDPMYQDLFTIRTKKDTQKYRVAAGVVTVLFLGVLAASQLSLFSDTKNTLAENTDAIVATHQETPPAVVQKQVQQQATKPQPAIAQVAPVNTPISTPPASNLSGASAPAQSAPIQQVAQVEQQDNVQLKSVRVTRPAVKKTTQKAQATPINVTPVQNKPVQVEPAKTAPVQVATAPQPQQQRQQAAAQPKPQVAQPVSTPVQSKPIQQTQQVAPQISPVQQPVQHVVASTEPTKPVAPAVSQAPEPPVTQVPAQPVQQAVAAAPTTSLQSNQAVAQQPQIAEPAYTSQNNLPIVNEAPVVSLPPLSTEEQTPAPAYSIAKREPVSKPVIHEPETVILDEDTHPAIKDLQVSAVAWSANPEARMAVVNDRIFHEGDKVGALTLEQINKSYLIFSLDGIRYRKNAS
jgi:type II secretory pathway predicted ATPase ExeA